MGTLTGDTASTRLGLLLKHRNDTDATDTANLLGWINDAYRHMCHPSVHRFREMQEIDEITLVTGTNSYSIVTLSSDTVLSIRWVTFIDATSFTNTATKRKLHSRGIRHFEKRTLATGTPTEYSVDGSLLYISGVPRSTENGKLLRVGFWKEPTAMVAGTTTVLPDLFDRPLIKLAQSFAEDDLGDPASSLVSARTATRLLNNLESEIQLEAEDGGLVEVVNHPTMRN